MAATLDRRKKITASMTKSVLSFALGFGLALMLAGHGRWDIIAGAVVFGSALYVGTA